MMFRDDGRQDRPGRVWIVELDRATCGHEHRTMRAAQECYRRINRAADRFERELPIATELVELVGDLTADGMGWSLLGIRGYERNKRGHQEWVADGWVSEIWAAGRF